MQTLSGSKQEAKSEVPNLTCVWHITSLHHPPILKQKTLNSVLWVGTLSGPACVHLKEHVWSKGAICLQGHLEKQGVLIPQFYGTPVAAGVRLISVQHQGELQLQWWAELHQGECGQPMTREWFTIDGFFLSSEIHCSKVNGEAKKMFFLTTPCPHWLEYCEHNVLGRHTPRWFSDPSGWWFPLCSRRQSECFGTWCGFCSPGHTHAKWRHFIMSISC